MAHDLDPCTRCGQLVDIDELDGKPSRFDRWWWHFLPRRFANWLLGRAADRGEEFDGLYCSWCFGPGWNDV